MAEPNLQEVHEYLLALAGRAGELMVSAKPSIDTMGTKKNSADLVTETDQAVENMVSSALKNKYPDYEFLGEESATTTSSLTAAPTFVVDPIDGTTNFVHSHPYISISLAFVHRKRPLIGVVYNPYTQHLYSAIKGHGAFLTCPSFQPSAFPSPLTVSVGFQYTKTQLPIKHPEKIKGLSNILLACEWGSEREGNNYDVKTATFKSLAATKESGGAMVRSIRSLGSAALNLCAVAAGHVDVYWEGGCWAWDVAAGWVILEEAGGMVVGGNKGEWEPQVDGRRYLAVRGAKGGQRECVEEFWGHVKGTLQY